MKCEIKPPKDLILEAKRLFTQIRDEYGISDATGIHYLTTACRHFGRMRTAQAILAKDGPVIRDRFGELRQHPAATVERDASASMIKAFRALNLDIGKVAPVGRPELMKIRAVK
jgi:P27 family predicted phage terminase small subunit